MCRATLTIVGEGLADGDLLVEKLLLLLDTGRKAGQLNVVDGLPDQLEALTFGSFGAVLLDARLLALVAAQLTTELGGCAALVVKVHSVCLRYGSELEVSLCRDDQVCWRSELTQKTSRERCRRGCPYHGVLLHVEREMRRLLQSTAGGWAK